MPKGNLQVRSRRTNHFVIKDRMMSLLISLSSDSTFIRQVPDLYRELQPMTMGSGHTEFKTVTRR